MYVLYKVEVWIKADLDPGTTLETVIKNINNLPSNKVDFVEMEDYLTETEKFIEPTEEATLIIKNNNGLELYNNGTK